MSTGPQVDIGPVFLPCQRSPDWQSGPKRLESWHSWQAEPLKFSWWKNMPSQCSPSNVSHPGLPGPYLADAGPVPVYAIQAGPMAVAWGLCPARALCGHPPTKELSYVPRTLDSSLTPTSLGRPRLGPSAEQPEPGGKLCWFLK